MSTINGISFSDPRNLNLKGGVMGTGVIRFAPPVTGQGGQLWATNPFVSTDYGLYINASGSLVFSSLGSLTVLGAAGGGGGVPSWNAIYGGSQTLTVSGTTFTIDGTHASNDVLTISDTAGGTGDLLQFINTGSGSDVKGTSGTWSFSALGAMTALTAVFAGTAASTSITLTLGNVVISAGGISVTKAANNATFDVTNNTVSTTVGSTFTFNGLTSGGAHLITSSGTIATTGYLLTLTANSATTAAGLVRLNANGLTSGIGIVITSSATAITGAGRLLRVDHTGATSSTGILSEFASAAADATVIVKITASAAILSGGAGLWVSASLLTTGKGINMPDLDALTTGIGLNIVSAATAIATTGRIFLSSHTGVTGTSAVLNEFISLANDETVVLQVKAASLTSGTLLVVSGALVDAGKGIDMSNLNALTTGIGLHIASSATAIATTGRLLFVNHTGATGTSAILSEFKTAATDETIVVQITTAAMINGVALSVVGTTGMTTGSLINATSSTAGAVATNGIYAFGLTGAFTSTASTLGAFHIAAASTVSGTAMSILGGAMTSGIALNITDPSTGMTSGSLLRVISATTGAISTNGVVSFQSSGAFTSTTIGFVNIISSGAVAGTAVAIQNSATNQTTGIALQVVQTNTTTGYTGNLVSVVGSSTTGQANTASFAGVHTTLGNVVSITNASASQTGAILLNVTQSGTTTLFTGSVVKVVASSTTGTGNAIGVTAVNTTAGDGLLITNNALTLGAGTLINLVHGASVIGAGSSMLRITSTGADTGTTTGCLVDLASSTATAGVLFLTTSATLATGTAMRFDLNGLTTGAGVIIAHTTTVIASGGSLLRLSSTSADSSTTTGSCLDISSTGTTATNVLLTVSSITSGIGMSITSASTSTGAYNLLKISNTNATASSTAIPLVVSNLGTNSASTKFTAMAKFGGYTVWVSTDGTLANAVLSGTAGDICFNGGASGKLAYCTGTVNWSVLT
jgi:hypothetical protein